METAVLEELKAIRAELVTYREFMAARHKTIDEEGKAASARINDEQLEIAAQQKELHARVLAFYETNPWKRLARWIWPR